MSSARHIFVPGVGQHDNIGDIILRRELIEWLRPFGKLHVYVGAAPEGYADALDAGPDSTIYYSFTAWYRALLRSAARGDAAYVFKPGEIQLTLKGMKEHLGMLPAVALVRLRRGPVARVGAGSRDFAPLPRMLMKPSIGLSHVTLWRDTRTAEYFRGRLMPDLAFGQAERLPAAATAERPTRSKMVVSMRSDRDLPSDAWFDAVRRTADEHDLAIVCVVQVLRDRERSAVLAQRLEGALHDWDGSRPLEHEEALRDLYRESLLAVSDRLHVLIAATTEGVAPAALLTDGSDKIDRHFRAAGIDGVSVSAAGADVQLLQDHLGAAIERVEETQAAARAARAELAEVRAEIATLFDGDGDGDSPQRVWHVGRSGEVAGGMTQVVNSYLNWSFDQSTSHVIVSRDGTRGLRGTWLFLSAAAKILTKRRDRRDVIVVHLSQGGSFWREGMLLRLADIRGFATVAHLHGSEFVSFATERPKLVRRVLAAADTVVVLSEETADAVSHLLPDSDVKLIPNAVQEAASSAKRPTVVFGGAVSRRKGVGPLLEAWSRVSATRPDWNLRIVGPIVDSSFAGLSIPNAEFTGSQPHDELMADLAGAEIAVLPSFDEAMPMFLIEAMANGCAVVATSVGGIGKLLDEGAGLIVPPGDVDELAAALGTLMDDAAKRRDVASRGLQRFEENYSMKAVAPVLERAWTEARDARYGSDRAAVEEIAR